MEKDEASRQARRVEHEANMFRDIFLEALEHEKERILQERKTSREEQIGKMATLRTQEMEDKHTDHFKFLEIKYRKDLMKRTMESKAREQVRPCRCAVAPVGRQGTLLTSECAVERRRCRGSWRKRPKGPWPPSGSRSGLGSMPRRRRHISGTWTPS
mmetsp:Transcript_8167/g.23092  ORF Transcript_8167/g.23092 Transcript_8167/m.23092 type:complete len:157 (+) Transcript_8167:95-565(+)